MHQERAMTAGRMIREGARRAARDERGSVAIMFTLMTVMVLAVVGGAVDFGRAVLARESCSRR
jgi:Flp pilus assembly protein TadG